ncbi:MAG: NMD3-related protein [Candidatus Aenigmatarchaeota archaeon]|nr:60S ribosomal export protein NMD3 [Candidatus Aenigmarchaeota archaeon]
MSSRCFVCGKRLAVIDGWCAEDWNAQHELVKLPARLEVTICSRCDRAKISGKWQVWNAQAFLRSKAKVFGRLDRFDVNRQNEKFTVLASGLVERGKKLKTEKHTVLINFNCVVCPDCSRALGGYYEAVLQLRGDISENVIKYFEREAAKISAVDARAFYSVKDVKEGFDVRIGSASAASKLARLLKEKYGAELKKSYKLVGRKSGKDIYRMFISVRFRQRFK